MASLIRRLAFKGHCGDRPAISSGHLFQSAERARSDGSLIYMLHFSHSKACHWNLEYCKNHVYGLPVIVSGASIPLQNGGRLQPEGRLEAVRRVLSLAAQGFDHGPGVTLAAVLLAPFPIRT